MCLKISLFLLGAKEGEGMMVVLAVGVNTYQVSLQDNLLLHVAAEFCE
jgi:hypothetical protein